MMFAALAFIPLYFILALATWIFYLAVMMLRTQRDTMPAVARRFAYVVLGIGYVLDALLNLASSAIFLELPREILFTGRMQRHIKSGGWRGRLAKWFCDTLLEPFDKNHCG